MVEVQDIIKLADNRYLGDSVMLASFTADGDGDTVAFQPNIPFIFGTERIRVNDSLKTKDVDYIINYANGEIRFETAPPAGEKNVKIEGDTSTYSWMSKLNAVDTEINTYYQITDDRGSLTTSANTVEYDLPANLKRLISVRMESDGTPSIFHPLREYTRTGDKLMLLVEPPSGRRLWLRYTANLDRYRGEDKIPSLEQPDDKIDMPEEAVSLVAISVAASVIGGMEAKRLVFDKFPALEQEDPVREGANLRLSSYLTELYEREFEKLGHLVRPPFTSFGG